MAEQCAEGIQHTQKNAQTAEPQKGLKQAFFVLLAQRFKGAAQKMGAAFDTVGDIGGKSVLRLIVGVEVIGLQQLLDEFFRIAEISDGFFLG